MVHWQGGAAAAAAPRLRSVEPRSGTTDDSLSPSPARAHLLRRIGRQALLGVLLLLVALVYALCNPQPAGHFDYQVRIANALIHGRLGISDPPSWLSEMVPSPHGDRLWYSVFPLGSVLSMLPVALIKDALPEERFTDSSIRWFVAVLAAVVAVFFFKLSARNDARLPRRLMLTTFAVFGNWFWPNLVYGAAWEIALGLAVLGEVGALYFTLKDRPRPLLAGLFFAIGFGNRTEVFLTAPLFLYLLLRPRKGSEPLKSEPALKRAALFLIFPFLLGVMTLAYNYARFGSVADFGYSRIPGMMNEMWYRDGFTSLLAIPMNLHSMLLDAAWRVQPTPPYLVPIPMGGSIFGSSPSLFLLFRDGWRDRSLLRVCWIAVILLTLALWVHGNQGGWQFSYRYAMVLLPWLFLILTENSLSRVTLPETFLLIVSVLLNAFATYQFYWTNNVHV